MKITVIGSGYVGLVTGTCLADAGHNVTSVDKDAEKIARLLDGELPIYEPGLDKLVTANVRAGRLSFSTQLAEAASKADVIFIAVGTPPRESDGAADVSAVHAVARAIAPALQGFTVIATKSTVPVGTGNEIEQILKQERPDADFAVVSNPEFLREGEAIADFANPDRIVVGSNNEQALAVMRKVYAPITSRGHELVEMDRIGAELAKYTANALLATRLTFMNEIADLCEKAGTNVTDVARAIGFDHRIGPAFLEAGPGYGGSCFPKDTLALIRIAEKYGAPQHVVQTVVQANDRRKLAMAQRVIDALGGNGAGKSVAVLGLAFKANTDDLRESPALGYCLGPHRLEGESPGNRSARIGQCH